MNTSNHPKVVTRQRMVLQEFDKKMVLQANTVLLELQEAAYNKNTYRYTYYKYI